MIFLKMPVPAPIILKKGEALLYGDIWIQLGLWHYDPTHISLNVEASILPLAPSEHLRFFLHSMTNIPIKRLRNATLKFILSNLLMITFVTFSAVTTFALKIIKYICSLPCWCSEATETWGFYAREYSIFWTRDFVNITRRLESSGWIRLILQHLHHVSCGLMVDNRPICLHLPN